MCITVTKAEINVKIFHPFWYFFFNWLIPVDLNDRFMSSPVSLNILHILFKVER